MKTSICQPALYVHGLACLAVLRETVPNFTFQATAGLSLGEFTAHAASGTFDFETGLDLVAQRAPEPCRKLAKQPKGAWRP